MIDDLIAHLQKSPEAGTPISVWRDDDRAPFNNLSSTPMLIRQQPGSQDRDIGQANFDLWLFSEGSGTGAQSAQIKNRINALQNWLISSRDYTGNMYGVSVTNATSGPMKDGQGRWSYMISIQVFRGLG